MGLAIFTPDLQFKLRDVIEPEEASPVEGAGFSQADASQPARDDLAQLVRASAADHVERRGYQCVGRFTRGGPRVAYADGDHDDSDKDNYPDKSSQVSAPY